MRKKLFAALAFQLAAVVLLLCFTPVMNLLSDKYGKDLSVPCTFTSVECVITDPENAECRYYLRYSCTQKNIDGIEYEYYTDDSPEGSGAVICSYDYGYDYSPDGTDTGKRRTEIWGIVPVTDNAAGKELYLDWLETSEDEENYFPEPFPASFYVYNDVRANFRIFRDRIRLVSVTVNGVEMNEFFLNSDGYGL